MAISKLDLIGLRDAVRGDPVLARSVRRFLFKSEEIKNGGTLEQAEALADMIARRLKKQRE